MKKTALAELEKLGLIIFVPLITVTICFLGPDLPLK